MPIKNKKKDEILFKHKKKSKSLKAKLKKSSSNKNKIKPLLSQRKLSSAYFHNNSSMTNSKNSFYSSIRIITSINNELDLLKNDLNSKFKFINYKNNSNINLFNKKNLCNSNCSSSINNKNNNKFLDYKTSGKNTKIKKMDNLYLYKDKNKYNYNNYKIYKQPETFRYLQIRNRYKNNSIYDKPKKDKVIRIFPSINIPHFMKNKKFDMHNINNACNILLQKD